MATLPKRVPTKADVDRITRTINDLVGYTGGLPTGSYLPLDGSAPMTGDLTFSSDNAHDVGASGATRPRTVYVGTDAIVGRNVVATGKIGAGVTPTVPLHVSESPTSGYLAILANGNATPGAKGVEVTIFSTNGADQILSIESGGIVRYVFWADGSFTGKAGEPVQKVPVQAVCTSNLTLTAGSFADVTLDSGANLPLTIGRWLVTAVLSCACSATLDAGNLASAQIVAGTATCSISNSTSLAVAALAVANEWDTGFQQWPVQVTSAGTIKLQAKKGGGTGSSVVNAIHTTLTAAYQGTL
jgi:hypothetical protein